MDWVERARAELGELQGMFYAPNIPDTIERSVRQVHSPSLPAEEDLLVVYDDTLFGGGDDGFVLTSRRICWKSLGEKPASLLLRSIRPDDVRCEGSEVWVGAGKLSLTNWDAIPARRLTGFLRDLVESASVSQAYREATSREGPLPESFVLGVALRHLGGASRVYFHPEVPERKLATARALHAEHLPEAEAVWVLYDDTLFGSARDGFLITPLRLCWKTFLEPPKQVLWQHLAPGIDSPLRQGDPSGGGQADGDREPRGSPQGSGVVGGAGRGAAGSGLVKPGRGPAPGDREIFESSAVPSLHDAVEELSWLLTRGYPEAASLKLVGDRHDLSARQRKAVERCACSDHARERRLERYLPVEGLAGRPLALDGFNCIIVTESILSGAPVFRGRDSAHRDLAGVHGTWRQLEVTRSALTALAYLLVANTPSHVTWWLDRPVSNSGRLRALLLGLAEDLGQSWSVELHDDPDRVLRETKDIVASADAWVLDGCEAWADLPGAIASSAGEAWIVDLSGTS